MSTNLAPAKSNGRHPGGRPTFKTPEAIETICDIVSAGGLLEDAANAIGADLTTVMKWEERDPEYANLIARARVLWAAARVERGLKVAEAPPRMIVGEDGSERVDSGWVQHTTSQLNYLKWMIAKRDPERFGDKVQNNVNLTGQLDHHHTISDERRKELMAMKQSSIERRLAARKAKQIEAKP